MGPVRDISRRGGNRTVAGALRCSGTAMPGESSPPSRSGGLEPMDKRVRGAGVPGNGLHLTNMYEPGRLRALVSGGRRVDGSPRGTTGPQPSPGAFLADADVWEPG